MELVRKLLSMVRQNMRPENKGLIRQAFELVQLQFRGPYSPFQYYDYQLCRRDVRTLTGLSYLGRTTYWRIQSKLNHPTWSAIASNKWLFYAHMSSFGLPVPRTYGYYDQLNGSTADGRRLRCASNLGDLLQRMDRSTFVVKPVKGGKGADVLVLTRQEDGSLESLDERLFSLQQLCNTMSVKPYLVQERVRQHEFMNMLNPYTLNTFRIVTFVDAQGDVHIHWTGLRLGRKGSNTDNVHTGGIGVHVDPCTGVLGKGGFTPPTITSHPDTGIQFTGERVPFWNDILDLACRAARLCPLGSIGWDIALSEDGPLLIEANAKWAYKEPQKRTGYLTPRVREHLAGHGIEQS